MDAERALDTAFAAACQNLAHIYGLRRLGRSRYRTPTAMCCASFRTGAYAVGARPRRWMLK